MWVQSYNALLVEQSNIRLRTVALIDVEESGGVLIHMSNFLQDVFVLGVAGLMSYTPPSLWPLIWGGAYGGGVHVRGWLAKRTNCVGLDGEHVMYGDWPSLVVWGKVRVQKRMGESCLVYVNARELNWWIRERAVHDLRQKSLLPRNTDDAMRGAPEESEVLPARKVGQ